MSVINSQPLIGASGNQGVVAYNIERSLRFRSSASANLTRTNGVSPTSATTWTYSVWAKRGLLTSGVAFPLLTSYVNTSNYSVIDFQDNNIRILNNRGAGEQGIRTNALFRDPSAWYHVVVSSSPSSSPKLYVNGVEITSFASNVSVTSSWYFGSTTENRIGYEQYSTSNEYYDGYMAEAHYIDGQALTPSSFGETDTATGVWKPKKYAGTYGTNGFYLKFDNLTSTSTLGNDSSGNSNTWAVNNISLTSGATYDSMKDVPTLTDEDAANYCTLNPISNPNGPIYTISNGNLSYSCSASSGNAPKMAVLGTIGMSSGKWYWEATETSSNSNFGIASGLVSGGTANGPHHAIIYPGGAYASAATYSGTTPTYTSGDIIGLAFDADAKTLNIYKNNTYLGQFSGIESTISAWFSIGTVNTGSANTSNNWNFGQRPFAYTPPSGFVALNTFNLPTPTIGATASSQANKYFDAKLYTGTGSSLNVTGLGFQPDLVWVKERAGAADHALYDAVRGVQKQLESNTTTAETTESTGLTAFNSDGFTVGALAQVNTNTDTYVAWAWDANGAGSSNTAGTISSTVSANTTAGFSIVTYTAPSSGAFTVGHGLGVTPSMAIIKCRNQVALWSVYHTSTGSTRLALNDTGAGTAGVFTTLPTSTTVWLPSSYAGSGDTYVAYCFAEVAGYSKFGSYTGNGSTDGPFVFTGFKPRYILIKKTNASGTQWNIWDSARNTYNVTGSNLWADSSEAEATSDASYGIDILSNGFKLRNSSSGRNASGDTYIFAAFAETPYKYSLGR